MSNKKFLRPKDFEDIIQLKFQHYQNNDRENTVCPIMLLDVRAINKEAV